MSEISLRDHYVNQVPTGQFILEHSQHFGSPDSFLKNKLIIRLIREIAIGGVGFFDAKSCRIIVKRTDIYVHVNI